MVVVGKVVQDAIEMARVDHVRSGISDLAVAIEGYRDDHGSYPQSMTELLNGVRTDFRAYLERERILNDDFQDRYEYQPSSNGFTLTVRAPGSFFRRSSAIEREFKIGEALR